MNRLKAETAVRSAYVVGAIVGSLTLVAAFAGAPVRWAIASAVMVGVLFVLAAVKVTISVANGRLAPSVSFTEESRLLLLVYGVTPTILAVTALHLDVVSPAYVGTVAGGSLLVIYVHWFIFRRTVAKIARTLIAIVVAEAPERGWRVWIRHRNDVWRPVEGLDANRDVLVSEDDATSSTASIVVPQSAVRDFLVRNADGHVFGALVVALSSKG